MSNVGPVILSVEKAREHLAEHGVVFSFRTRDRTTGETWYRASRTGEKCGDCRIESEVRVHADNPIGWYLEAYVGSSGFDNTEEWVDAIRDLHGEVPDEGYIYRITTDGDTDE